MKGTSWLMLFSLKTGKTLFEALAQVNPCGESEK
jgi:hypothetical protein